MQRIEGRTGKKRLGAALVGSLAAMMGMFVLILSGGIAIADISTGFGLPFKAQITTLQGNGLEQYGWFLGSYLAGKTADPTNYTGNAQHPTTNPLATGVGTTVETYLHNATLTGLQQTFCAPVPALNGLFGAGNHAGFEVQVNATSVDAQGLLADVNSQTDVTLNGVQANVPMGTTLGNNANYNLNLVTPPQDPALAGAPATYANTVVNADPGTPVTQYIAYQYATSLTLHGPSFHSAFGSFEGHFDGGACDWQGHIMGLF